MRRTGALYNGYNLVDINPIIGGDTVSIKSPVYLFGLRDGRIWISCKKGVLEFDPVQNAFKMAVSLNCSAEGNFSIVPLKETTEGIWCMQEKKRLVILSKDGRQRKTAIPIDTAAKPNRCSRQRGDQKHGTNDCFTV